MRPRAQLRPTVQHLQHSMHQHQELPPAFGFCITSSGKPLTARRDAGSKRPFFTFELANHALLTLPAYRRQLVVPTLAAKTNASQWLQLLYAGRHRTRD